MIKKILVPLDGSKCAEAILPHVENLARGHDAKVIFLRVIEPEPVATGSEPIDVRADPQSYRRRLEAVETYLATRRGKFRKKGIEAKTRVGEGPIVKTIIKVADHTDADLIAMASHGRTGLARVFYGSVAALVLHRADRPLLLIRSSDNGKF